MVIVVAADPPQAVRASARTSNIAIVGIDASASFRIFNLFPPVLFVSWQLARLKQLPSYRNW
jgi:hypothetical protein